jgi:hypothetical protein
MNIFVFVGLLTLLLVSVYVIIPRYAPKKDQESINNWVGVGFNGLLLVWTLVESRGIGMGVPVGIYLLVLGVCLSGVYWWIPKYINVEKQSQATSLLFAVTTVAVVLSRNSTFDPRYQIRSRVV